MRSGLLAKSFLVVAVAGLLALVPVASATDADFSCGGTSGPIPCTGTVTNSGGIFSTSGIQVWNVQGPWSSPATAFTLVFDTALKTISISNATDGTLSGTFSGFTYSPSATTANLTLNGVVFSTLPLAMQTWLGTPTGIDHASIGFVLTGNVVNSVDVLITPTPEPGSLMLLGSGLLLGGGILRRKLRL